MNELSTRLAVMLSSMPTAVNMTILAIEFDVRPRFVSSVVVVSTVASVLSLTLILVLLGVEWPVPLPGPPLRSAVFLMNGVLIGVVAAKPANLPCEGLVVQSEGRVSGSD